MAIEVIGRNDSKESVPAFMQKNIMVIILFVGGSFHSKCSDLISSVLAFPSKQAV